MEPLVKPVEMGFHTLTTTTVPTSSHDQIVTAKRRHYGKHVLAFYAMRMMGVRQFTLDELHAYVGSHAGAYIPQPQNAMAALRKQKKLNYRVINARKGEYEFLEVADAN